MSQAHWQNELRIPATLAEQLRDFRRRVWTIKLVEAIAVAAVSVLVGISVRVRARSAVRYAGLVASRHRHRRTRWLLHHTLVSASLGVAVPSAGSARSIVEPQDAADRRPAAGHHRAGRESLGTKPLAGALPGGDRASRPRRRDTAISAPRRRDSRVRSVGRSVPSSLLLCVAFVSLLIPAAAQQRLGTADAALERLRRDTRSPRLQPLPIGTSRRARRAVHI